MRKILNCKIFDVDKDMEYKIKTKHRIFGVSEMKSVINGLIDDENRTGIIAHGKELYCYKEDENYNIVEKNDMIIISDNLMEIFISF